MKIIEFINKHSYKAKYNQLYEEWIEQNELIDTQTAEINSLKSKIKNLEKLMSSLENNSFDYKKMNDTLERKRRFLAGKVGGLTKEINKLHNKILDQNQEKKEMISILDKLIQENKKLKLIKNPPTLSELKNGRRKR